jgi:hypothetical protein
LTRPQPQLAAIRYERLADVLEAIAIAAKLPAVGSACLFVIATHPDGP